MGRAERTAEPPTHAPSKVQEHLPLQPPLHSRLTRSPTTDPSGRRYWTWPVNTVTLVTTTTPSSPHTCIVNNWHALRADMRLAVAKQQPWGADLHTTTCNIVTYVYWNLHLCNNTCTCYIYVMLGSFIYSFTIVTHHDAWDCRPFAEHTPIATSNYSRQLVLRGRKTGAHSRRSYRIANCLWAPRRVICNFH